MARKKAAIGELIKSDMSRRTIGENAAVQDFAGEPVQEEWQVDAAPESERLAEGAAGAAKGERTAGHSAGAEEAGETTRPAPGAKQPPVLPEPGKASGESAPLFGYIAAEVEPGGAMTGEERRNFYDFMLGQALRYMRGFNAGKRFHQG